MRDRFAICLVLLSGSAAAQAPAADKPPEATPSKSGQARTGFQMHIVPFTMMSIPFGEATADPGDDLDARYGWQWAPIDVGLGAKIMDELYVGAYLNVGVGAEGGDLHTRGRCEAGNDVDDDVSCSSASVHAGVEARYSFMPSERMNAWAGYGIGLTSATQYISDAGSYSESSTAQGIDVARLSGGLDFRLTRGFGLGPFAVASVGRYFHRRTEIRKVPTFSGGIDDQAFHVWASLGLRLVIFP